MRKTQVSGKHATGAGIERRFARAERTTHLDGLSKVDGCQIGLISDHLGGCQEKFASKQLGFLLFNSLPN
jgi:hypothetical protein